MEESILFFQEGNLEEDIVTSWNDMCKDTDTKRYVFGKLQALQYWWTSLCIEIRIMEFII